MRDDLGHRRSRRRRFLGDSLLGVGLAFLIGGFRALLGFGRALLLGGALLRGGLLRRDWRALFRNGDQFRGKEQLESGA